MVTLNPAKMLHVDDKVGSLKVGKDGDVVLWSDNPLSIYAKSLYTIVDGTVYFDRQKDEQMQKVGRCRKKTAGKKNEWRKKKRCTDDPGTTQLTRSCIPAAIMDIVMVCW